MWKTETKLEKEQRIIQNIHDDFDNAQERLLADAKEVLASIKIADIDEQEQVSERLIKIGFTNVPIVKNSLNVKNDRTKQYKKINTTKAEAELIEYYKFNYPFLKFLTEKELDKICKKYNLVYASVQNYNKDVPVKNLVEIEKAQQLKNDDIPTNKRLLKITSWWRDCPMEIRELLGGPFPGRLIKKTLPEFYRDVTDDNCIKLAKELGYTGTYKGNVYYNAVTLTVNKQGLFICAPKSHFNNKGLLNQGLGFFDFTTEPQDPIVFRYVRGGVQVLSKWGLEANDELLVNPMMH